ncbi:cation-transporting P-type ATPase [Methylogaea oryzae]|uniref:cation-transporting P-type ATPase n=1 Tax=Methylogaea oryzae TaxID=1295382 RepID=UPI0020D15036|nr:cation-transporting P-type ATPase [Methylogaea oryzae]
MKIHQVGTEEAVASLHSSRSGLDQTEALRRLAEYGPNSVEALAGKPLWLVFIEEFSTFSP